MKPNHEVLWVTKEMNGKVLEVRTRQNGVGYFPMLVNEQAYSGSFTLWIVKAMLIDSGGFMMSVETILTYIIAVTSNKEFEI